MAFSQLQLLGSYLQNVGEKSGQADNRAASPSPQMVQLKVQITIFFKWYTIQNLNVNKIKWSKNGTKFDKNLDNRYNPRNHRHNPSNNHRFQIVTSDSSEQRRLRLAHSPDLDNARQIHDLAVSADAPSRLSFLSQTTQTTRLLHPALPRLIISVT